MTLYEYDIAGIYTGKTLDGVGVLPHPKFTTKVPPTVEHNMCVKFMDKQWVVIPKEAYGEFAVDAPIIPKPTLRITHLSFDSGNGIISDDFSEITCTAGSKISASAVLEMNGQLLPITTTFRMPITSADGKEIYALIEFQDGAASAVIPFDASGKWMINETNINSALPPDQHMGLSAITVYVTV